LTEGKGVTRTQSILKRRVPRWALATCQKSTPQPGGQGRRKVSGQVGKCQTIVKNWVAVACGGWQKVGLGAVLRGGVY